MLIPINRITIGQRRRTARKAAELSESIAQLGLLNPITVDKDYNLIAGLNRLEACKLLGWESVTCNVVELSGLHSKLAEIDENIVRDDLTVLEGANWLRDRKKIYEEIYPHTKAGVAGAIAKHATADSALAENEIFEQDAMYLSAKNAPSFVESTANLTGKAERLIYEEIQISKELEKFNDDLADLPIADQKTQLLQLAQTAKKDEKLAEKIVAELKKEPESGKSVAEITKEIRATEKKEERIELITQQIEDIENGKLPELQGLYSVISIDPPWNYEGEKSTVSSYDANGRRVANPYPEMPTEQIKQIKLPLMKDAVVLLWTTHKFLPDAFEILKEWGLQYKATMVWNKEKIGMGAWLRMQCEFCLIGIKGDPYWVNTTHRDIISEPRREHSRKPDKFFSIIEEITKGRRLEYFSREKRNNWDVFGNDTERF